ncbi:MAG: hypothetical protein ACOYLQ_03105 [Hyphomicrobiaceae bacterium]
MIRTFCGFLFMVVAAGSAAQAEFGTPDAPLEDPPVSAWTRLQPLEIAALRAYRQHVPTEAQELGQKLWEEAHSHDVDAVPSCGRAFETLSYMLQGFSSSARRAEIPIDWHHFAPQYAERRASCLSQLKVDASAFPLPPWFGR